MPSLNSLRYTPMLTQNHPDPEGARRWFLDAPEADVMSAARERELLLELAGRKGELLRTTRRPDGSEWGITIPDAEFQRVVHDLATPKTSLEPTTVTVAGLARRYEEIRTALAMANSRLVAHLAKRYFNRGISASDLIQEGFCGLLAAIDRFDTANTTRLATYAGWWIRQALQRAIAGGAYPVRLNPKQLQRLAQAMAHSSGPMGGPFTEVVSSKTVRSGADTRDLAAIRTQVSLDARCQFDDTTPLADLLTSVRDPDPEESEAVEFLGSILQTLTSREQLVLKLRFGLDGEPRHSLNQLGKLLQISKERVRQIEERAIEKLRHVAGGNDSLNYRRAQPSIPHPAGHSPAKSRASANTGQSW
jgi:RNA polymerase primary sigma factor